MPGDQAAHASWFNGAGDLPVGCRESAGRSSFCPGADAGPGEEVYRNLAALSGQPGTAHGGDAREARGSGARERSARPKRSASSLTVRRARSESSVGAATSTSSTAPRHQRLRKVRGSSGPRGPPVGGAEPRLPSVFLAVADGVPWARWRSGTRRTRPRLSPEAAQRDHGRFRRKISGGTPCQNRLSKWDRHVNRHIGRARIRQASWTSSSKVLDAYDRVKDTPGSGWDGPTTMRPSSHSRRVIGLVDLCRDRVLLELTDWSTYGRASLPLGQARKSALFKLGDRHLNRGALLDSSQERRPRAASNLRCAATCSSEIPPRRVRAQEHTPCAPKWVCDHDARLQSHVHADEPARHPLFVFDLSPRCRGSLRNARSRRRTPAFKVGVGLNPQGGRARARHKQLPSGTLGIVYVERVRARLRVWPDADLEGEIVAVI